MNTNLAPPFVFFIRIATCVCMNLSDHVAYRDPPKNLLGINVEGCIRLMFFLCPQNGVFKHEKYHSTSVDA